MALVAQGWSVIVALRDRGGGVTTRTYDLVATDAAGDASVPLGNAASLLADLEALTDCKVYQYHVAKNFRDTAFTLPTVATAENEQHLLITAPIAGKPNESATLDIPGPKDATFQATSGKLANVGIVTGIVQDFVLDFVAAGVNLATISDGDQLTGTDFSGKRTHSRSVKG
jgi:hypothetical protein